MKQSIKNVLLIIGFFLMLIVAYQYSFSNTLEVKRELDSIKKQVEQKSGSLQNINSLKEKEAYFDAFISENRIGNSSLQNNLLKVLNEHAGENSFKIINFKEPHVKANDISIVTSFQFSLEGEYLSIEEVLYKLEKDYSFGSLSSISFERKKDYRLHKNFLQCSVVVQNVE
ncbi:hypothetical protein OQ279_14890 [Salinimicrobium sp. MT39]|uniref:General secretion pathway protein n=1 Tax=Salinimicrobium profundisediminis TaxID=2994553 RepID=A0A9X3I1X9_9FLAO|nr:hypothetical protein [Salinimicrobium profundisediminis]MCX2839436.1 hypothetical protein [Salinimicrobium profundisediminis]